MTLYRVHFFDHGDNLRSSHDIEYGNDEAAIAAAHRLNVLPRMAASFEVWESERLVYRHVN